MARITVSEASGKFKVSRQTIYKKIKQGLITKDSNNRVDVQDCIRVLTGVNSGKASVNSRQNDLQIEFNLLKAENDLLKEKVGNLKQQLSVMTEQLEHAQRNNDWLKVQIENLQPKLLQNKKGFLRKLLDF